MRRRQLLVATVLVAGIAFASSQALAASTTIQITVSPNPTPAYRQANIAVSGSTSQPIDVYGTSKPDTAGAACASTPAADTGTLLISKTGLTGSYSTSASPKPFPQGSYLVCAWAEPSGADRSSTPLAEAQSVVLSSTTPQGSLSLTTASPAIWADQSAKNTLHWRANGPADLFLDERPASEGACAARRSGEPKDAVDIATSANSAASFPYTNVGPSANPGIGSKSGTVRARGPGLDRQSKPGSYRLCAYLQAYQGNTSANPAAQPVIAGPITATVVVMAPLNFSGRTSQGGFVRFTYENNRVSGFKYRLVYTCNDANHSRYGEVFEQNADVHTVVRNGSFQLKLGSTVTGRLSGHTASGTVANASYHSGPNVCSTGRFTFKARA